MSYTMPGQGGVGGAVAYYYYLNGVFEGIVSPSNVGAFEGNWAQQGISSLAVSPGQSVIGSGSSPSSNSPPLSQGTQPSEGTSSSTPAVQAGPTPSTDNHSVESSVARRASSNSGASAGGSVGGSAPQPAGASANPGAAPGTGAAASSGAHSSGGTLVDVKL